MIAFACTWFQTAKVKQEDTFNLQIIDAHFPLTLQGFNWQKSKNHVSLNDEVENKIESTIKNFYKENALPDSLIASHNLATIRLRDSLHTVFLILLKFPYTSNINGKLLFYDNVEKAFSSEILDYNIFAMYTTKDGKFLESELKKRFNLKTPEIQLIDFNNDGDTDFEFTRLIHNGTFNAIQSTIIGIKNLKVDTLSYKEVIIEPK